MSVRLEVVADGEAAARSSRSGSPRPREPAGMSS